MRLDCESGAEMYPSTSANSRRDQVVFPCTFNRSIHTRITCYLYHCWTLSFVKKPRCIAELAHWNGLRSKVKCK